MRRAARASVRTGAGPALRAVPPTRPRSRRVTSAPNSALVSAAETPAGPPPMTRICMVSVRSPLAQRPQRSGHPPAPAERIPFAPAAAGSGTARLRDRLGHPGRRLARHSADQLISGQGVTCRRVQTPEQIENTRDQPGPSGLVARPDPGTVVAVEVLIEEDEVAPVRIVLECCVPAMHWASPGRITDKDGLEAASDLRCDLEQVHQVSRTRRALDLEFIAVERVKVDQTPDDQRVDGHPHGTAPVGVAAEHPGIRLRWKIADAELRTVHVEPERVLEMDP